MQVTARAYLPVESLKIGASNLSPRVSPPGVNRHGATGWVNPQWDGVSFANMVHEEWGYGGYRLRSNLEDG